MRLRLAHTGDNHFDEKHRLEDNVRVHQTLLDQARAAQVNAFLIAGDLFERRSTAVERNAAAWFLIEAAEIAPVVLVKGNHDQEDDLTIFGRLRARHPIRVFDRPSQESYLVGGFGFVCLPWFDRAHLVSQLEATADQEATRQLTIAAASQLLLALSTQCDEARTAGAVPILGAHVMVDGSEISTGQVLQGTTVALSPHAIHEVGAEYAALGHIHKAQAWYDGRVAYAGSPHRTNYGEVEPKGWRLVTFEGGRFVSNELMELPARRIVLIERDWSTPEKTDDLGAPEHAVVPNGEDVAGALVRVRYRIQPQSLPAMNEEQITADLLAAGAVEVKIEAVLVHQARIRSEAIVTAETTWEKILAYWQAKGIELNDEVRARIRAKLDSLEAAGTVTEEAA